MRKYVFLLTIISALLLCNFTSVSGQQNQLTIKFDELPNAIKLTGNDLQVSKFSKTLKIAAKGLTQYKGANVAYQLSITLPGFSYNHKETKAYQNDDKHFFDASRDAAITLTIGKQTFGTLFRFKEVGKVLSKIATTDYKLSTKNIQNKQDQYLIQLHLKAGSVLQESSELKSKEEENKLTISDQEKSIITINNPQPYPPKVKKHVIQSSSEVWKSNVR